MQRPGPISTSHVQETLEVVDGGTLCLPQTAEPLTPPPRKDTVDDMGEEHTSNRQFNGNASVDDVGVCASPAGIAANLRIRHPKASPLRSTDRGESLASALRKCVVEHQLGLSVNLGLLVALSWLLFPRLRDRMEAFLSLSYHVQDGLYAQGPRDLRLVASVVVSFTAIRAFTLDYVLTPLASFIGLRLRKAKTRFAEQGFLLLYYIFYWTWGFYLFVRDTPISLQGSPLGVQSLMISLWTDHPRLYLDASMKLYYLSQLAFWTQQILVIHLEERRKDHYQMLVHHLVTVALMLTSYGFRQLRVGTAVLVCMDIVDLILPLAKILRYIGWQTACDVAFALFVVVWLAARHAAYLTICWSLYAHVGEVAMFYGTYSLRQIGNKDLLSGHKLSNDGGNDFFNNIFQPFLNPAAETVSFNARIRWGFLGLLLGLQCITLMWFVMICRVVARVLRGEGADDSRSDDEGDVEDIEDGPVQPSEPSGFEERKFIEVESTAEDLSYANVKRSSSGSGSNKRRSKAISSGLNLGDKKDILNRIGCLSEEQLAREREKREGSEGPRPGSR